MTMTAAQLLDELMGRDRNLVPGEKSSQVHWSDDEVCKFFICGFCPHDLFVNTKADLGVCSKIHDDKLKEEYGKSSRYGRMGYEEEFMRFLGSIQGDIERKIRRGHERLEMSRQQFSDLTSDSEKVKMLTEHINQLLEEIETLGNDGKVEEAQGVARLVEQLKEERDQNAAGQTNSQEKQMEVCPVCGAFLIVGDAQSRVDDHLNGKQHVGYARIKSALDELRERPWLNRKKDVKSSDKTSTGAEEKVKKEEASKEESRKDGDDKKSGRDRDRDRDKDRKGDREKERDRHREPDKDKRSDRDRGRDRDRERERDRAKDRDRDRKDSRSTRDRSRERKRSRERRRSSDRSRKRSRDRDSRRSHRSRSRERKRSRSRDRASKRSSRHGSKERASSQEKSESKEERSDAKSEKKSNDNTHHDGDGNSKHNHSFVNNENAFHNEAQDPVQGNMNVDTLEVPPVDSNSNTDTYNDDPM